MPGPKSRIAGRESEFRRDWEAGLLHSELTAKYGLTSGTITYTAKRLGLAPRLRGRPSTTGEHTGPALTGGQWVPNERGIKVWVPC